ncbi:Holliday junction branch migration protein RuvA [Rothia sp. P13129]|uniref:Holliday junction branch migration protein RuvA n=1 Tax=Rothia sp. P13129 TaxID=3402664 RepID=UPI003AD6C881
MISTLTGTVTQISLNSLILDVNGWGLMVHTPARTLSQLSQGETTTLLTSFIVREDSMTLYGFLEPAEREAFDLLLSVSGIGPRIALAALSVHTAQDIERAIATGDDKAFTKVPGVGPKTARRIVLELAGKLILNANSDTDQLPLNTGVAWKSPVLEALIGLGWSEKDAERSVESYLKKSAHPEKLSVPQALKEVLATLGQQHSTRH